jgi:hypothetical protein
VTLRAFDAQCNRGSACRQRHRPSLLAPRDAPKAAAALPYDDYHLLDATLRPTGKGPSRTQWTPAVENEVQALLQQQLQLSSAKRWRIVRYLRDELESGKRKCIWLSKLEARLQQLTALDAEVSTLSMALVVSKRPDLVHYRPASVGRHLHVIAVAAQLPQGHPGVAAIVHACPPLLTLKGERLVAAADTVRDLLGTRSGNMFIKRFCRCLCHHPDQLRASFESWAQLLEVSGEELGKLMTRNPSMLGKHRSASHISDIAKALGFSKQQVQHLLVAQVRKAMGSGACFDHNSAL